MIIPFQIVIGGSGPGAYTLRAAAAGRTAEARLELPPLSDDPAIAGPALGAAIFTPPLRQLLFDVAHGADEAGARLQLQLQLAAPELAALPWEWMSLGSQILWQPALRTDYALVRVGRRARPVPTLAVRAPLRLLIAAASGADAAAEALGAALAAEVRAGRLLVDLLRNANPSSLANALAEESCHLLHIVAPVDSGRTNGPSATLALPRLRLGRGLDPRSLAGLLEAQEDLRLVSFATDESPASVASLAAWLHEESGRATIALGGLEAAPVAVFAATCYAALAAGVPADLAVTDGRAALAQAASAWGLPQLYLAPGGEELFSIAPAESSPSLDATAGRAARRPRGTAPKPRTPRPTRRARRAPANAAAPLAALQLFRPLARPLARPTLPVRGAATPSARQLNVRLVVLLVALLILALMVSRVLQLPGAEPSAPSLPTSSAQSLPLHSPLANQCAVSVELLAATAPA